MRISQRHLWLVGVLILLMLVGFAACNRGQEEAPAAVEGGSALPESAMAIAAEFASSSPLGKSGSWSS